MTGLGNSIFLKLPVGTHVTTVADGSRVGVITQHYNNNGKGIPCYIVRFYGHSVRHTYFEGEVEVSLSHIMADLEKIMVDLEEAEQKLLSPRRSHA